MGFAREEYYTQLHSSAPPILVVSGVRSLWRSAAAASILTIVALGFVTFMVWPSQVKIEVSKTELVSLSWDDIKSSLQRSNDLGMDLDLKFAVQLRVRNPNLFGARYDKIVVELAYRGDGLGRVVLEGGEIPALSVVTVDGVMDLKGVSVMVNAARMLWDIAKGRLPLETEMDFSGNLEFLIAKPHIQARVGCDIVVNPDTNEIISQSCLLSE